MLGEDHNLGSQASGHLPVHLIARVHQPLGQQHIRQLALPVSLGCTPHSSALLPDARTDRQRGVDNFSRRVTSELRRYKHRGDDSNPWTFSREYIPSHNTGHSDGWRTGLDAVQVPERKRARQEAHKVVHLGREHAALLLAVKQVR